ncbi:MAG: hypothetical protein ACOYNS_01900 [Bacteroidota bacterium]
MFHILLLSAAVLVIFQQASAQRTVRMNIERMVTDAGMIVHGKVTNVESSVDPQTNILSTFVTIAVQENFYGADQPTVTLKMVGGANKRSTLKFAEMPIFKVGEEIYSLFYAPSKYGFTSPIGMSQGKFSVSYDAMSKTTIVRNGVNNARLFTGMKNASAVKLSPATSANAERLTAEEFSTTIRSLVTTLKK